MLISAPAKGGPPGRVVGTGAHRRAPPALPGGAWGVRPGACQARSSGELTLLALLGQYLASFVHVVSVTMLDQLVEQFGR